MADALPIAVNSRDLSTSLEILFQIRRPGMVWGPPGIGKSNVIRDLTKRLGIDLRDVRALLMNPVDVNGLPHVRYRTRALAHLAKLFAQADVPSMADIAAVFAPQQETAAPKRGKKADEDHVGKVMSVINSTSEQDLYGETIWSRPGFLPSSGRGILVFEEITAADVAVQAALYQVMLDFRIGDHVLAQGWCPMAASNRYNDKGVSNRMPTPLADRMFHFDLVVEWKPWMDWAIENGIHPLVIAYLDFSLRNDDSRARPVSDLLKRQLPAILARPTVSLEEIQNVLNRIKRETSEGVGMLHRFDPNERSFPTPRSWEQVSDALTEIENKDHVGSHIERAIVAGKVGRVAAEEMLAFAMTFRQGFSTQAALLNPGTTPVPPEPSMQCAVAGAMARNTNARNAGQAMEYILRLSEEYQVLYVKFATMRDSKLASVGPIREFMLQNQEIMA